MRRTLILAALLALALPAAAAASGYRPTGPYPHISDRPAIETNPRFVPDADGYPMVRYPNGVFYNPVTMAQWGLRAWSEGDYARARKAADWLVANQERATGAWRYDFAFDVAGMGGIVLPVGWTSAMAQGQAMSLLARVGRRTGRPVYLRAARRGLRPLRVRVTDGGLKAYLHGDVWFEEYPTRPASFALNGFQFTLIGLYDLSRAAPKSDAGVLFARGMKTLRRHLHRFDVPGGLSRYHLADRLGLPMHRDAGYHAVHIYLLEALDSISPSPRLRRYAARWAALIAP